ncbi:MAG: hypothetical protein QXI19_04075 [Candidatus Caldarchaeum sp.]
MKTKAPVTRHTARRLCEVWGVLTATLNQVRNLTDKLDKLKRYVYYGSTEWAGDGDFCCIEGSALKVMGEVGPGIVGCSLGTAKDGQHGYLTSGEAVLDLIHAVIGLVTEAGELANGLLEGLENSQVIMTGGKPTVAVLVDIVNVMEELGDVDWYKNLGLSSIGYNEEDARAAVLRKLETRYKGLSFSESLALERDAMLERMALEEGLEGRQKRLE